MPKLLDEKEAAHMLLLKQKTLSRWRWERKGPGFLKIGGAVRYTLEDLQNFLVQSRVSEND